MPRAASQSVAACFDRATSMPSMSRPSALAERIIRPAPVQHASPASTAAGSTPTAAASEESGSMMHWIGRPNCFANSKSRVSWAGTAMMAPVP